MSLRMTVVGGLVAGVTLGWLAPTSWSSPTTHANHRCLWKTCAQVPGVIGGMCGNCPSGQESAFWKCYPEQGVNCTDDPAAYGSTICTGFCSLMIGRPCSYSVDHCQ